MGLLDILNGMQNGPRGQRQPPSGGSRGGMSPLTMALLGLLAYKAYQHLGGGEPSVPAGGGRPAPLPPGTTMAGSPGGGLGDILGGLFGGKPGGVAAGGKPGGNLADALPGGLGGLLGGAAAGSALSGGLGKLIEEFQRTGQGQTAQSWIGTGPNQDIAPDDLAQAVGDDTIDTLAKQTGMSRDDLLAGLSQQLPDFIDQLTPHGRLPTTEEASRLV